MPERPYVVLSCAQSLDGFLDDTSSRRLVLSGAEDLDRVDGVRAACDAVLVGATTVRRDDPRLRVRSARLRAERVAEGRPDLPLRVTMTRRVDLDPAARLFGDPPSSSLVYVPTASLRTARRRLGAVTTVVDGGSRVEVGALVEDLHRRGVRRLLVEGGGHVLTQFLTADLVDELHLVVAPLFVGDDAAVRFVGGGRFPFHPGRRARLVEARAVGDVVLLRYALSPRFDARVLPTAMELVR